MTLSLYLVCDIIKVLCVSLCNSYHSTLPNCRFVYSCPIKYLHITSICEFVLYKYHIIKSNSKICCEQNIYSNDDAN